MDRGRLEAFSDAVIAIIMTIMVLELRPPEEASWAALRPLVPTLLAYVLSFAYLGIYWNNHHNLLKAGEGVTSSIMWSNLTLLFWLTLLPFTTAWIGETHAATVPTVTYGLVLLACAISYYVLQGRIVALAGGRQSELAQRLGRDVKGRASIVLYVAAILLAHLNPYVSAVIYVVVAVIWVVPDWRLIRTTEPSR